MIRKPCFNGRRDIPSHTNDTQADYVVWVSYGDTWAQRQPTPTEPMFHRVLHTFSLYHKLCNLRIKINPTAHTSLALFIWRNSANTVLHHTDHFFESLQVARSHRPLFVCNIKINEFLS